MGKKISLWLSIPLKLAHSALSTLTKLSSDDFKII